MPRSARRSRAALASDAALALALAPGCGGDAGGEAAPAAAADLSGSKDVPLDHTTALEAEVRGLRENAEALHRLSAAAGHDPRRLLAGQREEVAGLVREGQERFGRADPAYLVVTTPTMSEYLESWKRTRCVPGEGSTEKALVVASGLQDIEDIGGEAQDRVEAIAGQISQAAGRLDVPLES